MAAKKGEITVDLALAMQTSPASGADWLVISGILLCLIGGSALIMFRKRLEVQAVAGVGLLGLVTLSNLALLIHVLIHGTLVMTMGNWLPPFGIAFVADALSASFALTSSIAALACGIYACRDVDAGQRRFGFFPLLIIMLAGVNGAFLTGDIFNLYVWFEVLLIASFGLIVLGNRREQLDGALKYAILNFLATTLFLIATGYLYGIIGTLNMADIALRMPSLAGTAPVTTIAILFLVAFAMKAAAFPLNFWLPASYHTPNIVVGAVFAGLLTKVGVYALIRTFTLLFPSEVAPVHGLLLIIGALTMLVGAFGALAQSDLRRVLGYLVVSGIGYMLVGLGLNSAEGLRGGVFYAMHSIITMTLVYLLAGIIIKRSGSFQLDKIGGFYAQSPLLAGLFFIAMLAVSGLPPFSGFWPKLMLVQAGLQSGQGLVVFAIVLAGFVTTLCMGRLWIFMFLRNGAVSAPETELAKLKSLGKEAALAYVLPVLLLTSFVTAFGLWPAPLLDVVSAGVDGLINPAAYIETVLGVK